MRSFLRHPTSIPIQIHAELDPVDKAAAVKVRNLSAGGLCFATDHSVSIGAKVALEIPTVNPHYQGHGTVVWSHQQSPQKYEVGVRFTTEDEYFRGRMVEQVCQIEDYRQRVALKGRLLTSEEAAAEWIHLYLSHFFRG
jgi:Tfp pilus assembly protein PilZ